MGLADVQASVEAYNRACANAETFGHLAPKPRMRYRGYILFTQTAWGHLEPIRATFRDLPDSPWFFQDLCEWVSKKAFNRQTGAIFRFDGVYIKFKNGGYRFSGKIRRMKLT